jgi:hypothetical protein
MGSGFWRSAETGFKSCSADFRLAKVTINRALFDFSTPQNTNFHRFLHRCGKLWEETKFHTHHWSRLHAEEQTGECSIRGGSLTGRRAAH